MNPHPTLLNVAGTSVPAGQPTDGLDLAPLLRGESPPAAFDRALVWHFPNFWGPLNGPPVEGPGMGPSSTIRHGNWKMIYYHADRRIELFDLATDLGEKTNLPNTEPERVRALAREVSKVLRQHQAPMPLVRSTGKPVPLADESLVP